MGPNMRASGKRTSNMAMVLRSGLMVPSMLANTPMVASMGRASSLGLMAPCTKDNLWRMTFMVMESTCGVMAADLMDNGLKTGCMGKDYLLGMMAAAMRASGGTESSMAEGLTQQHEERNARVNGKMAGGPVGSLKMRAATRSYLRRCCSSEKELWKTASQFAFTISCT